MSNQSTNSLYIDLSTYNLIVLVINILRFTIVKTKNTAPQINVALKNAKWFKAPSSVKKKMKS